MTKKKKLVYISIAAAIIVIAALTIIFMPKSAPQTVTEMLSTAQKYLVEMEYERAIAEFNKVIELDPMNADAYLGLAEAYEKSGDINKAVETLEKGYELTGDERLQARLALLTSDSAEETQTSAETEKSFSAGDTEPMRYYSDGTLRSERIYTNDSGAYDDVYYYYQGFEMLRESYGSGGTLENAKVTLPFYGCDGVSGYGISEYEGKTEKTDGGYTISPENYHGNIFVPDSKNSFELSGSAYSVSVYAVDDNGNIRQQDKNSAAYSINYDVSYNTDGTINGSVQIMRALPQGLSGSYSWTDGSFGSEIKYDEMWLLGVSSVKNVYEDGKLTEYGYSKSGRLIDHREYYADGDTYTIKTYDSSGNVTYESTASETAEGSHAVTKNYKTSEAASFIDTVYDEEDGNEVYKSYNESGMLVYMTIFRTDGSSYDEYYDDDGKLNLKRETDKDGNEKLTDYNASGEIISTGRSYYNADGIMIREDYDNNNKLSSRNEFDYLTGNDKYTYYDESGNITGYSISYYNDDSIRIYEHYLDGRLSFRSEYDDFNNTHKSISYDENGNITDITED